MLAVSGCAAAKKVSVAVLGHPASPCEMAFPSSARAIRLPRGVDAQHESRDLRPVGAVLGSVEQAEIGNQVLFVISRQAGRRLEPRSATSGRGGGFCMTAP